MAATDCTGLGGIWDRRKPAPLCATAVLDRKGLAVTV